MSPNANTGGRGPSLLTRRLGTGVVAGIAGIWLVTAGLRPPQAGVIILGLAILLLGVGSIVTGLRRLPRR